MSLLYYPVTNARTLILVYFKDIARPLRLFYSFFFELHVADTTPADSIKNFHEFLCT